MAKIDENANILWNREFGGSKDDYGQFVQATADGGYLITGYSKSPDNLLKNQGGADLFVIKTDSSGSLQWQKTFGGSSALIPINLLNPINPSSDNKQNQ